MTKIITSLSDVNYDAKRMRYRNWIQHQLQLRGCRIYNTQSFRPDWEHPKEFVYAAISWGRWYVKCPGCGSSCAIDECEPFFFCPDCMNIKNDFLPQQVIWPNNKKIERLNEIMAERPDYKTRNWLPHHGETEEDLIKENIKYLKKSKHVLLNS